MIGSTRTLDLLVAKMQWQVAKSEKHNQNISQSETPGYKRVDIEPFEKAHKRFHTSSLSQGVNYLNIQDNQPILREEEIMKLTETASDYNANLHIFKKYLSLLKTVVGAK